MMINNIQMARTSTLLSTNMSEVIRTYLNSDFQFVNLNIKQLDKLADKVVDSIGI